MQGKEIKKINLKEKIASPLNYLGGKYKLLDQIIKLFPKKINTFVDLFCGGINIGINVNAQKYLFNDVNNKLINLYKVMIQEENFSLEVEKIIENYNLSNSKLYGYTYYKCDSSKGLASYNKNQFLKLREDFNNGKFQNNQYYIVLYVLIIFAFNNQIRFNNQGLFNLPIGKRDFNLRMEKKLKLFIDKLKLINCEFTSYSFEKLDIDHLNANDLVYVDPPYLITMATYNENNQWNIELEKKLLDFLDLLNQKKIRFALSNVLEHDCKENTILKSWLQKNSNYKLHYLNYNYRNSNYRKINKKGQSKEVLITNF